MNVVARTLIRLMDPVNLILKWVLAALLATMCVLIGWQIFARFVVGEALDFSEEASRFIMVWLVLLGAAYAAKDHRLIRVDALERSLTLKPRSAVMLTAWIASIVFYLMLIWFGISMAGGVSYQLSPATEISMTWAMAALPVGGALMLLNTMYAMSRFSLGLELTGAGGEPQVGEGTDQGTDAQNADAEDVPGSDLEVRPPDVRDSDAEFPEGGHSEKDGDAR